MIVRDISRDLFDLKPNYREKIPGTSLVDNGNDSGQFRLGISVRNYLSVRTILTSAGCSK